MPSFQRLRCDPHGQATAFLQRLVVLAPVAHPVSRLGDLMTPCFVGFIGHGMTEARVPTPILPCSRENTHSDLCTNAPASPQFAPHGIYAPTPNTTLFPTPNRMLACQRLDRKFEDGQGPGSATNGKEVIRSLAAPYG